MQAVVKMPRIEPITIKGETIPENVISFLKQQGEVTILDDDTVLIEESDWYKNITDEMTPGIVLRTFRKMKGLSQKDLGLLAAGLSKQNISDMEKDRRTITKENARKFAEIFGTEYKRFL